MLFAKSADPDQTAEEQSVLDPSQFYYNYSAAIYCSSYCEKKIFSQIMKVK